MKRENLIGEDAIEAAKQTILINNPVGSIMGYYDENLTIISVDEFLLSCLNYGVEDFYERTGGSLKNLCCGSSSYWMDSEEFRGMQGMNEGQILTSDGTPIAVRVYKNDSVDVDGNPIWIQLGCFEFCVEDNGVGMTEEFQKILFEPFTRADDHRTTNVQGTGLGMAITKNIIQMMNGDIKVYSVPNQGTKVTVTIYMKIQNKKLAEIEELINLPILVVDDDETACESTVATLTKIGIVGEWVTSEEDAIRLTLERYEKKEDYFAILMDWQMPGMDGLATTREIRKHVGRDVTIIVLTAFDYREIEEEARAAGVDAFIEKPLFPSRLTATLKNIAHEQFACDKEDVDTLLSMEESDYTGRRILLVEDNDLNREIAAEILRMTKVQVDCAANGKEAVEKIEFSPDDQYNLVLMDILQNP